MRQAIAHARSLPTREHKNAHALTYYVSDMIHGFDLGYKKPTARKILEKEWNSRNAVPYTDEEMTHQFKWTAPNLIPRGHRLNPPRSREPKNAERAAAKQLLKDLYGHSRNDSPSIEKRVGGNHRTCTAATLIDVMKFRGRSSCGNPSTTSPTGSPSSPDRFSRNGDSDPSCTSKMIPPERKAVGGGIIFDPIPASKLSSEGLEARWLWHGLLALGRITALFSEAKAGKTTLIVHLCRALKDGTAFCGRPVAPARVLIVSEEGEDTWAERRDEFGLEDHVFLICNPFKVRPNRLKWEEMIGQAVAWIKEHKDEGRWLVVLDTMSHLWPVEEENSSSQVAAALMPLRQLSEAGPSLLLVHHQGKTANGPRGSSEFSSFVDILADMQAANRDDPNNCRRILQCKGRHKEIPTRLVIEMAEDRSGYRVLEGAMAVANPSVCQMLGHLLPPEPPGLTAEEVVQVWPADRKCPDLKTIQNALPSGVKATPPTWQRGGRGTKNDPYRYWRPQPKEGDA